jgi:hypothetical protein
MPDKGESKVERKLREALKREAIKKVPLDKKLKSPPKPKGKK